MRIPLHLDRSTPDDARTAAQRYELWTTNMRAKPRGFRQELGTGSTRRRPHNTRRHGAVVEGPVHLILNGLVTFGQYA